MRSLYWKIFISFWLATILIIITTAWVTSEIAQTSSIPAREQVFMDSYANAAVATFEAGQHKALQKWLAQTGIQRHMALYLLTSKGEVIGSDSPPQAVKLIGMHLVDHQLDEGILKSGNLIISHEILSTSGTAYRLAAVSEKPLAHFIQIPWAGLTIRLIIAIVISGLICYMLSLYVTRPLRSLRIAARSIATGEFGTRVGRFLGHKKDEIAELSKEFDSMAAQLESLVLSKERLLRDISHELRSPLARLQIAIELGRKQSNNLANIEFERMEMECMRLNDLIGEILEFARLDKSTSILSKSLVNLPNLLNRIINDANYEYTGTYSRITLHIIDSCELLIDERLIHRAIENILRNALRYSTKHGRVTIQLSYADHQNVLIDISDEGPGIPEEQLTEIFRPFYRVDSSRVKSTGGYGLGLAIAYRAVKMHDGEIVAKNSPAGGLSVQINLPKLAMT
ncbi:MAG: ATP-binding protein [Legionella sp.]